jgi:nicotinamide riboside kinase
VLKIILTGPESSGKSTMAQALATALGAPLVPEFARSYLAHLGRPYRCDDLPTIARGQQAWEDWFADNRLIINEKEPKTLICDTDWTVIQVWEEYKFGVRSSEFGVRSSPLSDSKLRTPNSRTRFYFLCAPDIPWQPDPQREHPHERAQLFEHYERLLRHENLPYHILRGPHAERLQTAQAIIQELF